MQINEMGPQMQVAAKIGVGIVNGLILLALYVANANCSFMGFNKPAIGVFAEIGCLIGLVALAFLLIAKSKSDYFLNRWILIVLVTFWNQMCLIMFLASLIPFYSH